MGSLKHVSSGRDSYQGWRTPKVLADHFRQTFNLVLDAAADKDSAICPAFYDGSDGSDGLKQPWTAPEAGVWCNPPYRDPAAWLRKAYGEVQADNCMHAVLLVPAAVGTDWFTTACQVAEVHLFDRRIRFELPPREELPLKYQDTLYKKTRSGYKPKVSPGGGNALVIVRLGGKKGITKMLNSMTGTTRLTFVG